MDGQWRIELLGGLRVWRPSAAGLPSGTVISRFRMQKAGALLAFLAFHDRPVYPRDLLAEVLWPEIAPEAGRNNLRGVLHSLRKQLAASGEPVHLFLVSDRGTIGLRAGSFTTDVGAFTAALQTTAHVPLPRDRATRLAQAVALYGGELLPDFYEEWVLRERERLRERYLRTLQQLAAVLEESGDLEGALKYADQALAADPLREEAHYALMRLHAAAGQPAAALRQYQELERLLRQELGENPSATTRALAEELRANDRVFVVAQVAPRQEESLAALPSRPDPGPPTPAGTPPSWPLPLAFPTPLSRFFGREAEIAALVALLGGFTTESTEDTEQDDTTENAKTRTTLPRCGASRKGENAKRDGAGGDTVSRFRTFALSRSQSNDPAAPTRLVTLTGPGGSGKTRLAIEVARRLTPRFDGAVGFVPLVDVADAERLGEVIADAVAMPRPPNSEGLAGLVELFRQRPWLLVLDNFEHLVESGALLVQDLLARAPALTCLVTSRTRLDLGGEQEFAVMPLPTPRAPSAPLRAPGSPLRGESPSSERGAWSPEHLSDFPSVQLFVDRARAVYREFVVTEANAAAVAELCDRLEGLPLALELAAAWAQTLTPSQMLERLERRFELLVSRHRDPSPRHQSLRATIEWSYARLAPEQQQLLAQLSVFRGGFSLEAVEAVCDHGSGNSDALSTHNRLLGYLRGLQACSLVVAEQEVGSAPGGAMRYRLLETLREFAAEQLDAAARAGVADRHARFFLALAEEAEAAPRGVGPDDPLERLEREHDNLRAALEWSRTPTGDLAVGLALGAALGRFWEGHGHLTEGRKHLAALLAALSEREGASALWLGSFAARRSHTRLVAAAGRLARLQGQSEVARAFLEQSLSLARELGDASLLAHILSSLAITQTDPRRRDALYQESLALYRELGDQRGVASTLVWLGSWCRRYDPRQAQVLYQEALATLRRLGEPRPLAWALIHLAGLVSLLGDLPAVCSHTAESLALSQAASDPLGIACCQGFLGSVALAEGRLDEAQSLYEEALRLFIELDSRADVALMRIGLGKLAAARGDAQAAAAQLEEALATFPEQSEWSETVWATLELGRLAKQEGEYVQARARFAHCLSLAEKWDHQFLLVASLEGLAEVADAIGEPEQAARFFEQAAARRQALGMPIPSREGA
jgi:predicted ATPase/DNA-binding SARP family transcriptional activator